MVLNGVDSDITALKSKGSEILVGRRNGAIELFDLGTGDKSVRTFEYHREFITDLCWFSPRNQRNDDKTFVSSST